MRKVLSFLTACFLCIGVTDAAVRTTNSNARNSLSKQATKTTMRTDTPSVSSRNTTTSNRRAIVSRVTNTGASRATVSRTATNTTQREKDTKSRTTVSRSTLQPSRITRAATESKTFGTGYNSCRDAYFTCMDQFCATADDSYRRCICSSRLNEIKSKQRALNDAADEIQNFKDLNIDVIPKTAAEVNAMLNASDGEYAVSIAKDLSDSAQKLAGISSVLTNTKSKSLSTSGTLDIAGDINSIWANTNLANGVNIANLSGEMLYNAVHFQCADLVGEHCESKSTLNMVIAAYGMYIENDCTILSNALDNKKASANAAIRETEREMEDARLQNYNAHNATSINDCVAKVRRDITNDTACGENYVHCLDISGLYLNQLTGEPIYTANFYKLETMLSLNGDILTNQTNRMLVAELNRKRSMAEKSLSTCQDLADDVWDEFMRQAITEIYQGQQSKIRQVKEECLDVVNKCYDSQTESLRNFSNIKEQLLLGSQLELSEELCREKLNACSNLYGGGTNGMREMVATMRNITSQKIAQNCLTTLKEYVNTLCTPSSNDTLHSYPYACRAYAPGEQTYATNWACQNATQTTKSVTDNSGTTSNTETSTGSGRNMATNSVQPSLNSMNGSPARSGTSNTDSYVCEVPKKYINCNSGYYLSDCLAINTGYRTGQKCQNGSIGNLDGYGLWTSCRVTLSADQINHGNTCIHKSVSKTVDDIHVNPNQTNVVYPGGTECPYYYNPTLNPDDPTGDDSDPAVTQQQCGDYPGSLYQKVVRYALQSCMRPSEIANVTSNTTPISTAVLQDVNTTIDSVRVSMSKELKQECERLGGYWITTQYNEDIGFGGSFISQFSRFYAETGANTKWGYCANADAAREYFSNDEAINDKAITTSEETDNESTSE